MAALGGYGTGEHAPPRQGLDGPGLGSLVGDSVPQHDGLALLRQQLADADKRAAMERQGAKAELGATREKRARYEAALQEIADGFAKLDKSGIFTGCVGALDGLIIEIIKLIRCFISH